ncbi:S8 family serine peptidase [Egicoccus sp. AB-alg6-2]|uniref:S8 family serine peptidase n=1 Tax=Egicoccus sp. AB-alg6-2 TaxID=3242692 RepID=UPI00359CF45A
MRRKLASLSAGSMLGVAGLLAPLTGAVDPVSGAVDTITGTVTATIDDEVARLSGTATVLVILDEQADVDQLAQAVAARVQLVSRYDRISVLLAQGPADDLRALAELPGVARLEHDAPIGTFTDSSHTATRGQELLDGEVTVGGQLVDGTGVGVAVVDTGVDGWHPDLAARMGENVKVVPSLGLLGGTAIDFPESDTLSLGGHGTHVAGIVAGDGTASAGTFHGAATGATIHGVSGGTLISLHSGLEGLYWVLENHDTVTPAIRVVNNSWGGSAGDYDPDGAIPRVVRALIEDGVVVVFAAGNSGGDGSVQATSIQCVDPTPGMICVAAYDDLGTGGRLGTTASFSSRGDASRPETWPDLSAPGVDIVAACRPTLPVCATGVLGSPDPVHYAVLSGTSMAAPHIAGIAAQVLQVAPHLTPAQVEQVLTSTATSDGTPGYEQGAGLVDAVAAVQAAAGESTAASTKGRKALAPGRNRG